MKHSLFLLVLLSSFAFKSKSQTWLTHIDESSQHEYVTSLIQTLDGGYLVAGTSYGESNIEVVKLDVAGKKQWSRILDHKENGISWDEVEPYLLNTADGNYIVGASTYPNTSTIDGNLLLWHLNSNGDVLDSTLLNPMYLKNLKLTEDHKLLAVANTYDCMWFDCDEQRSLFVLDSSLQVIDELTFEMNLSEINPAMDVIEYQDARSIMLGNSAYFDGSNWRSFTFLEFINRETYQYESWMIDEKVGGGFPIKGKLIESGEDHVVVGYNDGVNFKMKKLNVKSFTEVWEYLFEFHYYDGNFIKSYDGGFVLAGAGNDSVITMIKLDSFGFLEWQKSITINLPQDVFGFEIIDLLQSDDGGIVLAGDYLSDLQMKPYDIFVIKTDAIGNFGGNLDGFIRGDVSQDCVANDSEPGLNSWIVEAKGNLSSYYTTADHTGYYYLRLPIGNYQLFFSNPELPSASICQQGSFISIENQTDTITSNIAIQGLDICPILSVDVGIPLVRNCTTNSYKVQYCNFGTEELDSFHIEISQGHHMEFISASTPFMLVDSNYIFSVQDLQSGECGYILFTVFLDCQTPPGEEHCLEARIILDNLCLPDTFIVNSPLDDIDCQTSGIPYDPNDKAAYPIGAGTEKRIHRETPIRYTIRFQNIGTDTAFKVTVRDTLSAFLDKHSFQAGGSSHPYTWDISAQGVLEFNFDNILLPDSSTHATNSNAFVNYSIQPKEGLLPGHRIENSASIYLDYAPPVRTNLVFHTIDKDTIWHNKEANICAGEIIHGIPINMDTMITNTIIGVYEDSIVTTAYIVFPVQDTLYILEYCQGDLNPVTGLPFDQDGEYHEELYLFNQWGCDSILHYAFLVHPLINDTIWFEMPKGTFYDTILITNDTLLVTNDTTASGCSVQHTTVITVLTTSIIDAENSNSFRIYPNPFSNKLWIQRTIGVDEVLSLTLIDGLGQIVGQIEEGIQESNGVFEFKFSNLSAGSYLLQIKTESGLYVYPVVKLQ